MRGSLSFFRLTRIVLATAFLSCIGVLKAPAADASAASDKDSAKTKTPLSPQLEAKLKEIIDKAKVDAGKSWDERIKKEIAAIATVTGLNDAGQKALEPVARQAASVWIDGWSTKLDDSLRKELSLNPALALRMLDQMSQIVGFSQLAFSQVGLSGNLVPPFQQDIWNKALHQTLTAEQIAAWDKSEADRKATVEKEIGDALKNGADRIHEEQTQAMLSACREIEIAVELPKDRADKLEALGKSVVDQTTEMWRNRLDQSLLEMDEDQRHQFTLGRMFIEPDESEALNKQSAWKDGVAALLTPEDEKRLQAWREEQKTKRAHVLGELMLVLLDEKVAFTTNQRTQLQPIADRLVRNVPELFPENGTVVFFSFAPNTIFGAAEKATDNELKPILDESQLRHWRHLADTPGDTGVPADDGKPKPAGNTEPEDVERCISQFLYEKTEAEKQRVLAANTLKAEDATRAAGLNAEAAAQLQVAARGATEEYISNWKWFTEQQIRFQLAEVTPQNVRQRLESFEDYFFQRNYDTSNHLRIWDKTVKTDLNATQQAAWQKETDARATFHDQAIADLVMSEFDRKNQLTPDQWNKLAPIITGVVKDYSPDISRIFAFNNGLGWYMEPVYALMPFAGVPEADLKAILTPDQLDHWKKSQECANATSLWQNIMQMHNQRVPPKKAGSP
jgi:hypothetical protein